MTLLNISVIKSLLTEQIDIELFDTIDSTNDYLLTHKKNNCICLAEHQTKGKGQLGRKWHSPHGENIYLSYRTTLQKPMNEIGELSIKIGEAVCDTLNKFGIDKGLTLKWPNDVLFEGKKLAGILIEVQPGADNTSHVVFGVGLNVNLMSDESNRISQPWTSMQLISGKYLDRNRVVASLIDQLIVFVRNFDH